MCVFEIRPQAGGWRLAPEGEVLGQRFETYAMAERRARWLAVREDVRGLGAEINVLDANGDLVGTWRAERYCPALTRVIAA